MDQWADPLTSHSICIKIILPARSSQVEIEERRELLPVLAEAERERWRTIIVRAEDPDHQLLVRVMTETETDSDY